MDIQINIDTAALEAADYLVEFNAKYADSIYNGFYYRNGRQHPDYDYVNAAIAQQIDIPEELARNIEVCPTIYEAFEKTAEAIKRAFERQLAVNNSGMDTLNWYHRDHEPFNHIELKKV